MPQRLRAVHFGIRFVAVVLPAMIVGACASQQPTYQQARVATDNREQSALGNTPRETRAATMYDDMPEERPPNQAQQRSGQPKYQWNGNPERETFKPGYDANSANGDDGAERAQVRKPSDAYRPPDA